MYILIFCHFRIESFDYIFSLAMQMKQHGLDPTLPPSDHNKEAHEP